MQALRVTQLRGSALFEDAGRRLVTSGVPVSGAFDRHAHEAGARLVGGTMAQTSVEVLGRIELEALVPVTCAVTGEGSVSIDGVRAAAWTAMDVGAGRRIEVRATGRAYVAVAGGFQPAAQLGSRSTCVLGPIGPTPIGVGDLLPLGPARRSGTVGDFVRPPQWRPHVRVIAGPLQGVRLPLFQTSANLSGEPAPHTFAGVVPEVREEVDLAIDGGELTGLPSTVVDLTAYDERGEWEVLREGGMSRGDLIATLGPG